MAVAVEFRVGDIIEMSCAFTEARVEQVTPDEVFVEWPWWAVDPDSDAVRWNGVVALAAGPDNPGWEREVFRVRPQVADLSADAVCRIGIPPTVVHVIDVRRFDPPRETGWLPRPRRQIGYLRAGQALDPGLEDQGASFDPDDGIPRRIELRFRPYAFLEPGDEVADARARVWRFEPPWDWHPFDGGAGDAPTWPLTLLTRNGDSDDDAAAVDVAEATQTGSHREELARWATEAGLPDTEEDSEFAEPVE
ncbi:hypothetical protein KP696_24970 [Nocardia seriolae]|uniref:Uncharacterized protein n=1 Tax=Nocardia seriolae TaxID=37332 RepID=A0A0B8NL67_9NOCA|nr:hypothetical protein [Nocardia seriolae]MTJ61934.1 hypothetical protein [Nocardia seriolae]MTJ76161.1 hypothetical protein [Nocardia seriolae]MTJ90038.1 hypothetical protein [Nocardia seriolae]MTK34011.1 hypothetical protein [Nocardia seriolae]MTK39884.1 hypothetical protein [Nocardia seriolae]